MKEKNIDSSAVLVESTVIFVPLSNYITDCFILLNVLKDKATWSKKMLHIFCDICIKAIAMGMRPNTYFNKMRWKFLITSFQEQTGHAFTKTQLKNK